MGPCSIPRPNQTRSGIRSHPRQRMDNRSRGGMVGKNDPVQFSNGASLALQDAVCSGAEVRQLTATCDAHALQAGRATGSS